jgi:CubicO group peptidase (beta-lactamase class C family)
VLVRRGGRSVFEQAKGIRDLRTRAPIGVRTDFRLASVTKQLTAAAIVLLVRDGRLRYDEPLTEALPGFPPYGQGDHDPPSADPHVRAPRLRAG